MYNGKYSKVRRRRRGNKRTGAVVLSLLLLLTLTIGGTLAYLAMKTDPVENVFTPSHVDNEVKEEFPNSKVKENVKIENTGDIDAYIRAQVLVYWGREEDGKVIAYGGSKPELNKDYTISWTKNGWIDGSDGYYYYQSSVKPEEETGILFTDCQLTESANVPEGYTLIVEVLGQSIQADGVDANGTKAVELAWGFVPGASN